MSSIILNELSKIYNKRINDIIITRIINKVLGYKIGYDLFKINDDTYKMFYYYIFDDGSKNYIHDTQNYEITDLDTCDTKINKKKIIDLNYDIFFNNILNKRYLDSFLIDDVYRNFETNLKKNNFKKQPEIDFDFIPLYHLKKINKNLTLSY